MRMVVLQVLGLVLKACVFACYLVIHGFAVPQFNEGMPDLLSNSNMFISIALSAVPQSNGTGFQPPPKSEQLPQATKGLLSSTQPSPASAPLPFHFVPVPPSIQNSIPALAPISPPTSPKQPEYPPFMLHPPVPSTSPASSSTSEPVSMPPKSHQSGAPENNFPRFPIAPAPPPSLSVFPEDSPSFPPVPDASSPPALPTNPPPTKSILPKEPPSSPPAAMPVAAPANESANRYAPVSHSPTEAPSASKPLGHSNRAPSPHPFSKSTPGSYSPRKHHHPRDYMITPAPLQHIIPPASSEQAPRSDPKAKLRQNAAPPTSAGSSLSPSQILPPISSADNHYTPAPTSSPKAPSKQAKIFVSPEISPSGATTRNPKMPPLPPLQELPPPPPHTDCARLTCTEPLTYGPPESPCICVLPIQVGLSLNVALYTFFPLVSRLAEEIASGVFMKQSQVRIMGANADGDNPQKTIVLIDLVPLTENFNDTMAYLTFQRFWSKQVVINTSFFGDYFVLYVRYPGLPPSPPLPPPTNGITGSTPYPGHDNNARTIQPLGVDIRQNQHKDGSRGSILASVIVSASVIVILLCSIAWVLLSRHRDGGYRLDPTPPNTFRTITKLSGLSVSMVGSGPSSSSPSFSLGSSIATYTGSAKTFSSSDIERATDHFNETRILGEGGFGVVYSGVLEDGTQVAMKILKRYDQQGGREFLAEVEMLSRLHHRNLVKLIGICIEHRTRCLVYELIPNGSVESHLHGIDKETAPLDWSSRLKIALGAARALAYLHEDSSPRVIHRDFKASNILLEDDYTPKVSDFGLARTALEEENKHISTRVMGTFGYVAPEYAMTGHLLVKSDVYSYGVVLLELLTGKKPIDMSQPPGQENLVSWARPLLTSRESLESIIDPSMGPNFPFDSIAKVGAIASMCVQPEVSHRPFMGEVVQALKLVYNECNEIKESQEDLSIDMEARKSTSSDQLPDPLSPVSPVSEFDYRLDVDKDLSMSELLSSTKFERDDSETFRRNSSSGPLRTSKAKRLWKTVRRLSGGSVSEHGVIFRLWPGSH